MTDAEVCKTLYTANMCTQKQTKISADVDNEGRLNVLGIGLNARAENVLYTEVNIPLYLKVEPAWDM